MDSARKIAGFNELSLGINNGIAPNLLEPNQAFNAVNVSFRGDFPGTRDTWITRPLQNIPATWTGIFQGMMHYDGEAGQSGWIVARGGRFFFITDNTYTVTDITAKVIIVTTADFVLPGAGNPVTVNINGNPPITGGQTITIGAKQFTVTSVGTNQLNLVQVTAGAGTVVAGTAVFDSTGTNQITEILIYPPTLNFVFMFQAENYAIILGGQERTLIWDGQQLRPSGIDEVPSGFLGAYGWGRIWITNPDRRTFVAGDIVFGPSGTAQNGYRDAILKFTENDFLNEGGSFGVPYNAGPITAMQFLATQDTSLGIGVLLVGTTNMVFSVNAPTDRTTWKNLTYPIQTVSLIDYGPLGPRNTVPVNGDMWYRSLDGVRSFIVARRLFGSPGNTPMSHEVPLLEQDTEQLLFYGSGMLFDNKLFLTISPFTDVNQQVAHRGLLVMNFDLLSDLRTKQQPCWEGIQTGLNMLQVGKARIDQRERAFAWAQGPSDVELWELLDDGINDQFVTQPLPNGPFQIKYKPIAAILQSRAEDYGFPLELKRLIMAELYLEDVADTVQFQLFYKPDQYPNWVPWGSFSICSLVSQCQPDVNNCIFKINARTYAARITFPQPSDDCNVMTSKPLREFHECQFQLTWQGHLTVRRFMTHIKIQTQPTEGICPANIACVAVPFCTDNLFTYDSHA